MPHISVMLGSVLLGVFNRTDKEKKFGTFIVHPLLLGFHSCWVRSSGFLLYVPYAHLDLSPIQRVRIPVGIDESQRVARSIDFVVVAFYVFLLIVVVFGTKIQ